MESKINQVQVAYQQFYTSIGIENVWKGFLDGAKSVIDTLNSLPKLFGTIPVGAIAMVTNIISLIKTVVLQGFSSIATNIEEILQAANGGAANTAQAGGANIGATWGKSVAEAIRASRSDIQNAMDEALGKAKNGNVNNDNIKNNNRTFDDFTPKQTARGFNAYRDTPALAALFNETRFYDESETGFGEEQLNIFENVKQHFIDTYGELSETSYQAFNNIKSDFIMGEVSAGQSAKRIADIFRQQLKEAGKSAEELPKAINQAIGKVNANTLGEKIAAGLAKTGDFLKNHADVFKTAGQVGSLIAATINTETEAGMRASGATNALGGVASLGGAIGLAMAQQWPQAIMTAFTGITNIISGFSSFIITGEERLDILTKKAETLNNEAKQAKSEANILDSSLKKIEELEKKRFEDEESAEEYNKAVNDLANQFPELIVGFDAAGNAIINAARSEEVLAAARQKSADAAYEAAKGETKRAQQRYENAVKNYGNFNGEDYIAPDSILNTKISSDNYSEFNKDLMDAFGWKGNNYPFAELSDNTGFSLTEIFEQALDSYINDSLTNDLLNSYKLKDYVTEKEIGSGNSYRNYNFDAQKIIESGQLPESVNNFIEKYELYALDSISQFQQEKENIDNAIKEFERAFNENPSSEATIKARDTLQDLLTSASDDIKAVDSYKFLLEKLEKSNKDFEEIINAYNDKRAQELLEAATFQDTLNKKIYSYVENSAGLTSIVSSEMQKLYENGKTVENNGEDYINLVNKAQELWESLGNETNQALFDKMLQQLNIYSFEDIISTFDITDTADENDFYNILERYYSSIISNVQDNLINFFDNLSNNSNITGLDENWIRNNVQTQQQANFIKQIYLQAEKLSKQGLDTTSLTNMGEALYSDISNISDTEIRNAIFGLFEQYGIITKSGIEGLIKAIKSLYPRFDTSTLSTYAENMVVNVGLELQTSLNTLTTGWEEQSKELSKLISGGLSLEEADQFIAKAAAGGLKLDLNKDFINAGGKLTLTAEAVNTYWEQVNTINAETADIWQSKIHEAMSLLSSNKPIHQADNAKILSEFGITDEKYYDELGFLNNEGQQAFKNAINNIREQDAAFSAYLQYRNEQYELLYQSAQFNQGDWSALVNIDWRELANTKNLSDLSTKGVNIETLRNAKNILNEQFSSLISDVLTLGFENIDWSKYTAILNLSDVNIKDFSGSYEKFIERYLDYTGQTIESINDSIIQAIQKDRTPNRDIINATKDLTFTSGATAYGSLDSIKTLADTLKVRVDTLIGNYIESLDSYAVELSNVPADKIQAILANESAIADSVNEFLQSIVDAIGNGIQGKLTYQGRDELIAQLGQLGINSITAADFTQTADGLKLSVDAAYELYKALSQIDTYKGQLVFDELYDSLTKTGEACENILTTMASIATAEGNLGKVPNGDLQERLNLYRQIARVQMDNPDSYKFMDNKLPTGMQGAVNFYNDWAEAAKTIKSSSASGYMGMQDFYNIINEINNMAAISGEVQLGAYTLDGNLSSAANLIQDAFNSLEMVDGKGMMVKLSGIGADFSFAGADFSDGVNSGLQDFAQSQIDMLDGMIQMLETVVAMETLMKDVDLGESGEINIDNLFPKIEEKDAQGNIIREYREIDEKLQEGAKTVLELAKNNEDLNKALEELKINGNSIGDILRDLAEGGEISEENAILYTATIQALNKALQSGKYDLESLNKTINEVMQEAGLVMEREWTDQTGKTHKIAIGFGVELEADENGKYIVDNQEYDNYQDALAALSLQKDVEQGAAAVVNEAGETTGVEVVSNENVTVIKKYNPETQKMEYSVDGLEGTFNTEQEALKAAADKYIADHPEEIGPEGKYENETEQLVDVYNDYGVVFHSEVKFNEVKFSGSSHSAYEDAKKAVINLLKSNGTLNDDDKIALENVGVSIEVDENNVITEGSLQQLKELFNIEDKTLNLTIESVQGDDVEWLKQLLESKDNPIPITATISVTNGKGEASGEGGGVTADGTYSIDTIQLAATAIQLVQGEGGKPTVDVVGLGTLLTGAIYLATQLATLIPGDAFDTSVDKLPLDNIPLQQAILKVINILLDAAESKVNDVGVVAAAKANPFSIDNLTATVLALLLTAAPEAVDQSGLPLKNGSTLAEHIGLLKAWVDSILVNASDADVNNSGVKAQVKSTPIDIETLTAIVNDILAQLGIGVDPQSEMSALIPDDLSTDKDLSVNVTPKYQLAPGAHTPTEEELNTLLGISNLPSAQRDENGYIILPGTQTGYQGQGPEYTPPTEQNAQEVIINGNNVEVNGENSNTPAPSDNTNTTGQFEGAAQAAKEAATEMSGAADTVTTVSIDAKAAVAQTQNDIQSSAEQIESTAANVAAKTTELGSAAESASGNVENLVGAINSIPSNTEIGIGVNINVDVSSQTGYAPITSATIHAPISNKPVAAKSKGNVALSKGRKTLMGELGPELVVSHGRYYVVGENGAEFVDLDDDAIVFNHLQTKRLLQNGITSRGAPITNERNAVSFATGTQGPALASAAQALAQLKQIRAMWESMLTATLSSLGKKAGSGGGKGKGGGGGKGKSGNGSGSGGGGGGGGGEDDKEVNAAYIADLERWYNLLRQIAKLEQDISYEEQLRSKIESDRVVNGSALYESRKRQLDQLDQEIAKNKELSALQKSYYDARRKDLESTNFGKIFTFDENGLMQWNDNAVMANGQRGGLFALEELNRMDEYGRPAYTARQQYEMLKSWGFSAEMEYDNNGNKIELEDINDEEGYAKMVQAFNDRMDGWKDELDSLYDSYNEQLEKATSNETKRNELLQQIVDNQLSVEKSVLGAIEAREKAVIDELKNEQTALKESTDAYLDGLNRQLDQEKQLYARQDQDQELTRLQRQLAILQRTGGSASQIRSLQNEIANKSQDRYFDLQQEQIDAVKDAAEKQQEQLDQQIKIMEETLEYQKENGLLWAEVAQVMQGTPQEITAFIAQYTPSYRSNSELQIAEDLRKLTGEVEDWVAYRDDEDEKVSTALAFPWESFVESTNHRYDELLSGEVGIIARAMFDELYSQTGDSTKSGIAVLEWLEGKYGPGAPQELTPEQEAAQAEAQKTKEWAQELYEELTGIYSQITGLNANSRRIKALDELGFDKKDILKIFETYYADVIKLGLGPGILTGTGANADYDPKYALEKIELQYFTDKTQTYSQTQANKIYNEILPILQRIAEGSSYKIDLINNSTYTPDVQLGTLMNPYWGNMSTELESLVTTLRPTSGGSFPESKYLKQIITDWLMKQWKTWQAPGVAIKKQSSGDRRLSGAGGSTSTEPYSYYTKLSPVLQTQLVGSDGYVYVDTEGNIYKIVDNDISKDIEARAAGYTGGLVMTKEQYDAWMSSSSVYSASQVNQELEHLKAVYGATSISDLKGLLGSNYKLPSGYTLSEAGGVIESLGRYDTAFNTGLNVGTLNAEINITTTDANVGQEVVDALNAAMQKTARRVP